MPEGHNDLRRMQLRELAQLNGTLRETDGIRCSNCGSTEHKSWLCPDKPNVTNNIVCSSCGGAGHIAKDCRSKRPGAGGPPSSNVQAKIDEEYLSLMAELGEGPVPAKTKEIDPLVQAQLSRGNYSLFDRPSAPKAIAAPPSITPPWNSQQNMNIPPLMAGPPQAPPGPPPPLMPPMPWMSNSNNQPPPPGDSLMPPGTGNINIMAPPGTQPTIMPPPPGTNGSSAVSLDSFIPKINSKLNCFSRFSLALGCTTFDATAISMGKCSAKFYSSSSRFSSTSTTWPASATDCTIRFVAKFEHKLSLLYATISNAYATTISIFFFHFNIL